MSPFLALLATLGGLFQEEVAIAGRRFGMLVDGDDDRAYYLNEEKNCQVSLPQFAGKACPKFPYEHSTNGLVQLLNDEQTLELIGANVVESTAIDVFEHEFIER
jgi:hypothetical protein